MGGRVRDISILVRPGTPEWPGDTPYECRWPWRTSDGASVNVSAITMSPHVGTHADAPLHVRDGWADSAGLALDDFCGPAWLSDVRHCRESISLADLHLPGEPVSRLLLRTGRTIASGEFPAAWPVLHHDALRDLLTRGLRLLGLDAPSVDSRHSNDLPVHVTLFAAGANVLENLDLRDVPAGEYVLRAFPLHIAGLDAAPVRAVLEHTAGA